MKKAYVLLAASVLCAVGCGQKGPLYLPQAEQSAPATLQVLKQKSSESAQSSSAAGASLKN